MSTRLKRRGAATLIGACVLVAVVAGYVLAHHRTYATGRDQASPTPSPPVMAGAPSKCLSPGAGQHQLDPLDPPEPGFRRESDLDWSSCGAGTIPLDGSQVRVGADAQLAESHTCPVGSGGEDGNGTVITIAPSAGTTQAAQPVSEIGDWDHGIGEFNVPPGLYRFTVSAISGACQWHFAIYVPT